MLRQLTLERETVNKLKDTVLSTNDENARLRKTVLYLETTGSVDVQSLQKSKELEDKLRATQEELTTLLRQKALNAADLLDANRELQKRDERISDLEGQLSVATSKVTELSTQKARLDKLLEVAKSEVESAQMEVSKKDIALRDSDALMKRLQDKMMDQADKFSQMLNEQTLENDELRRSLTKMQAQLDEALKRLADGQFVDITRDPAVDDADRMLTKISDSVTRQLLSHVPTAVYKKFESGHGSEVNGVAFSDANNGALFATVSNDKVAYVWDGRSHSKIADLHGSTQALLCVDFASNGQLVLAAGNDCTCRLWNLPQYRLRHALTGHTGKIYGASFSPDARLVCTGSHDRTIKVWDVSSGYCTKTIPSISSCNDVRFTSSDNMVVSGHHDGCLKFWDTRDASKIADIQSSSPQQLTSVMVSRDGTKVLTNGRDNVLRLYDVRTHAEIASFRHSEYKNGLNWCRACISPDAQYVAAGSLSGKLIVWNVNTGRADACLDGHSKAVSAVTWAPDGSQLLSSSLDGSLISWK